MVMMSAKSFMLPLGWGSLLLYFSYLLLY